MRIGTDRRTDADENNTELRRFAGTQDDDDDDDDNKDSRHGTARCSCQVYKGQRRSSPVQLASLLESRAPHSGD